MSVDDSWKLPRPPEPEDPIELQIQQEVEEFLRDLVLEYPFHEVFDCLRKFEFQDRYGAKILPMPHKRRVAETSKEIRDRIGAFLNELRTHFGAKYEPSIQEAFRYYTKTTME